MSAATSLDHALALAARGFKVTWIHRPEGDACSCGSSDCRVGGSKQKSIGKHPIFSAWQDCATGDAETLRGQYASLTVSDPNVGIACGLQPTGRYLVAIDEDDPARLRALEREHGTLPATLAIESKRGRKLFGYAPEGYDVARLGNRTGVGGEKGVDIRAEGGQVVAPPSMHASGTRYRWGSDLPIAELPQGWLDAIASSGAGKGAGAAVSNRDPSKCECRKKEDTPAGFQHAPAGYAYQGVGWETRYNDAKRWAADQSIAGEDLWRDIILPLTSQKWKLPTFPAKEIIRTVINPLRVTAKKTAWPNDEIDRQVDRACGQWAACTEWNDADSAELGAKFSAAQGPAPVASTAAPDAPPAKRYDTIGSMLDTWRREGPLVHEPTGIATIDNATGGGPVYGSRWYVIGAPDAWKTGLLTQLAFDWACGGISVGILAVDEEATDIMTRFAQMVGVFRSTCEARETSNLDFIRRELAAVETYLRMYPPETTIEDAAADIAEHAKASAKEGAQPRAALLLDSIQAVSSAAGRAARDPSPRETVNANVAALRAMASRYRLIGAATSEMNRGGYRSVESAEQANDLATAKESGAIEYSARVLLSLRSVKDDPDLVEVRIAKNKHGRSWRGREDSLYLRGNRTCMRLAPAEAPNLERADERQGDVARAKVVADAALVAAVLLDNPDIGVRVLYSEMRARHGTFAHERVDTALARLGKAVARSVGARGAHFLRVDADALDPLVRGAMSPASRSVPQCPGTVPRDARILPSSVCVATPIGGAHRDAGSMAGGNTINLSVPAGTVRKSGEEGAP